VVSNCSTTPAMELAQAVTVESDTARFLTSQDIGYIALGPATQSTIPANADPNYYDLGFMLTAAGRDLSDKHETVVACFARPRCECRETHVLLSHGVIKDSTLPCFYATRTRSREGW